MAAEVIRVDWGSWGTCGHGVRALVGTRAFLLRAEENKENDAEPIEAVADAAIPSSAPDACPFQPEPDPPPPPDEPMLPGMQAWIARSRRG